MSTPAVSVRDLHVVRGGTVALDHVDLDAAAGEVMGLLGPSGCGKTTLMRALVGVQRVAGGEVRVLGHPAGAPPLRRRVGYATQAGSVYADLSVGENLRFFARVLRVGTADVARALALVDLERQADQVVGTLSGGQRSRVSLAVALLAHPEVLVLDEPTVGLDPVLRRDLWALFHRLAAEGTCLVVSSHVMDEAERCDRLVLMRDGQVLAQGSPEQLRQRSGAATVEQAFLDVVGGDP